MVAPWKGVSSLSQGLVSGGGSPGRVQGPGHEQQAGRPRAPGP